jgi:phytoene synthase
VIDDQILGFDREAAAGHTFSLSERVEQLRHQTREACANRANEPVFQALAMVCSKNAIAERHPLDLIAGFQMDADARHYATLDQTLEYCYHVAGVVGVMMAIIMGVRDRPILERAADLGIAFQLTNIARDVITDHHNNRIYLPSDWLHEAGLDPATMALPQNRGALFSVVSRLLETAEPYYHSASLGLPHLPSRSAWAIATAGAVYREIGLNIKRAGPAAWDSRPRTSGTQKFRGTMTGLGRAFAAKAAVKNRSQAPSVSRDGLWTKANL